MAFSVAPDREAPQFTTVSSYRTERLGAVPQFIITYHETRFEFEPGVVVDAVESVDADAAFEKLHVKALAKRTDLVGKRFYLQDGTLVGRITAFEDEVVVEPTYTTSTTTDADGNTITTQTMTDPGSYTPPKVTMDPEIATDLTGTTLYLPVITKVGTESQVASHAGRSWEVRLPMAGELLPRMQQMMVGSYVEAGMNLLAQLGITTVTQADVQNAVVALGQKGVNMDSFLTSQAESIEKDRRAGKLPSGYFVHGSAPKV